MLYFCYFYWYLITSGITVFFVLDLTFNLNVYTWSMNTHPALIMLIPKFLLELCREKDREIVLLMLQANIQYCNSAFFNHVMVILSISVCFRSGPFQRWHWGDDWPPTRQVLEAMLEVCQSLLPPGELYKPQQVKVKKCEIKRCIKLRL